MDKATNKATIKRRSSRGKGSIYRDAERGTWIGAAVVGGQRQRVRAKTKLEARQKLNALLSGEVAAPAAGSVKVRDLVDNFRRSLDDNLAPSTKARHRWACSLISECLGHLRADQVKQHHLRRAFESLADRGLSQASLVQVRSTLSQAFEFAVGDELVASNPVGRRLRIPSSATKPVPRRALNVDQAERLLEALRDHDHGLPYLIQLRLGLRPGEVFALGWDSVDLEAGTLTVSRGVQRVGGRVVVTDQLKTTSSRRTLAIPPDLIEALRRYRRSRIGGLMFSTRDGNPVDPKQQRLHLARICDEAGLPVVTPNELRHTAASLLLDRGAPIERVADMLGHRTIKMLDQHYKHRVRPAVDTAARYDWVAGS